MTVQLNLPPEAAQRLTEKARKRGLSLDGYLLQSALEQDGSNDDSVDDDAVKRAQRERAAASIREVSKGNILGPDLTVRDLIEEGRRF